jgi:DNA mismatch endonuclease, patch repair protein
MVDHIDPSRRSANMAAVKSKNTSPEIALRKLLHRLGYRYRLHLATLPGRPDIVFPARRKVIFVNGCFWHRHEGCKYTTMPKTQVEFWEAKFLANRERDIRTLDALRSLGWEVAVVWQCQIKNPELLLPEIIRFLGK